MLNRVAAAQAVPVFSTWILDRIEEGLPGLVSGEPFAFNRPREFSFRGCSSAGRAPDLHSGGRRFDPDQLHQVECAAAESDRLVLAEAENRVYGPVAQVARAHP